MEIFLIIVLSYMIVGYFVGKKVTSDGRSSYLELESHIIEDSKESLSKLKTSPRIVVKRVLVFIIIFIWPVTLIAFPTNK